MTLRTLDALVKHYPDLPREAILKTDLLRLGVAFTPAALCRCASAKPKSYFIFSFDRKSQKELSPEERHCAPEEIALIGGPWDCQRTIVSVRLNPDSPYRIDAVDEHPLTLQCDGTPLCTIELPTFPAYYARPLANGKPVTDIAPTLEWGYLIYLTTFRLCQYWGREEECQYCDINENYRQQRAEGRSYTGVKTPEDVCEALAIINELDVERQSRTYTVTGGSITTQLQGLSEGAFYARYAEAIESRFPGRWIGKAVVQALSRDEARRLRTAGYQIYHPNFEVWDPVLFDRICPGKARHVGREEWIRRIMDAAEFFRPTHVIPNFVAGVEMAKPHGFTTIDQALQSTGAGLDWFMARGILPRFTVWCVEPNTTLARTNPEPPPLAYFAGLLQRYCETFHRYGLPLPPGYGPTGRGRAVFSVSAFMDVLPESGA
ncbi:MAG: radical SAM protein [Deltaproteobacteria bacterium]|nr:radical SAM protein [Deltaproteobacteria bacterium]